MRSSPTLSGAGGWSTWFMCVAALGAAGAAAADAGACLAAEEIEEASAIQLGPRLRLSSAAGLFTKGASSPPARACSADAGEGDDRVHVLYASDVNMSEGVLASVASAIRATATPLTVHVLLREDTAPFFRAMFQIRQECVTTTIANGAVVRLHMIEEKRIHTQKFSTLGDARMSRQREDLEKPEVYARFYAADMVGPKIVIWLDADTIVQSDLTQLRDELKASGRTVGFARSGPPVAVLLGTCPLRYPLGTDTEKLLRMGLPNNGVYVVDLKRWVEKGITKRIEDYMHQQKACNQQAYKFGNNVPEVLAFFARPADELDDYIIVDAAWNKHNLGCASCVAKTPSSFTDKVLQAAKVLHWNGRLKPWLDDDAAFVKFWRPHREDFDVFFSKPEN